MVFKNICVLVLWTKVALALEGLKQFEFLNCVQSFPVDTQAGNHSSLEIILDKCHLDQALT